MDICNQFGRSFEEIEPAFDIEMAPKWSDRQRLEAIGINMPDNCDQSMDDDQVAETVATVIAGLAMWHIFILDTDHISDRELLCRLIRSSAKAETPCVPPMFRCASFISLKTVSDGPEPVGVVMRDRFLPCTPLDVQGHGDYDR